MNVSENDLSVGNVTAAICNYYFFFGAFSFSFS